MSYWTYISGVIKVVPFGKTQAQKRYVLETVLGHLPKVTGSENNMKVHIVQSAGYNSSSSCNEFGESLWCQRDADCDGWLRVQDHYMLVVEAHLRDRMFEETLREFNKWINRVAKRLGVEEVLVRIEGQGKICMLTDSEPYWQMHEWPSWCKESGGEPAWWEFMMWDGIGDAYEYPLKLAQKYYDLPEIDEEMARREAFLERISNE